MKNRYNILQIFAILFMIIYIGFVIIFLTEKYRNPDEDMIFAAGFIIGAAVIGGFWFKKRWVLLLMNILLIVMFIGSVLMFYVEMKNQYSYRISRLIRNVLPFILPGILAMGAFLFFNNEAIIEEFDRGVGEKYDFEKTGIEED